MPQNGRMVEQREAPAELVVEVDPEAVARTRAAQLRQRRINGWIEAIGGGIIIGLPGARRVHGRPGARAGTQAPFRRPPDTVRAAFTPQYAV
jgi:hypothetical protein